MELTFTNSAGERFTADGYIVFQYLQQGHSMFIGVTILCVVVSIMLWLFFSYHLYLIREGYTTNESSKKSELEYFLGRTTQFFTKWEELRLEDPKAMPSEETMENFEFK